MPVLAAANVELSPYGVPINTFRDTVQELQVGKRRAGRVA